MSKEIEKIIKKVVIESDKRFEKRLKHHTEALIEVLNDKFEIVKEQFKYVYEKLDSHTEQIGNILMDTTELKSDIRDIRFEVINRPDNKVDKKHFVDLEQRMRKVEGK